MGYNSFLSSSFWSFLSFISIQTIPPSLAKLYIVSHSSLLQTQYPPWPSLARFHLPCCVYSSHKFLFQLKNHPQRDVISCCPPSQLHKVSLRHHRDKFPFPKPLQLPRRAGFGNTTPLRVRIFWEESLLSESSVCMYTRALSQADSSTAACAKKHIFNFQIVAAEQVRAAFNCVATPPSPLTRAKTI